MIQYRLGAFGFLASEDVHKHGKTNAGLLDMRFALEWVQSHISKFGGDPTRVTIGGESAGAGAVMLQAMAYGGREDHLFNNVRQFLVFPRNPADLPDHCREPLLCRTVQVQRHPADKPVQ